MSFATFLGAKVKRIIYIASDLSKILRYFNDVSLAIYYKKYTCSKRSIVYESKLTPEFPLVRHRLLPACRRADGRCPA